MVDLLAALPSRNTACHSWFLYCLRILASSAAAACGRSGAARSSTSIPGTKRTRWTGSARCCKFWRTPPAGWAPSAEQPSTEQVAANDGPSTCLQWHRICVYPSGRVGVYRSAHCLRPMP